MKVKKASNFNLFDICFTLIQVPQNKKRVDVITYVHLSRNLKTLKKTSNIKYHFSKTCVHWKSKKRMKLVKL